MLMLTPSFPPQLVATNNPDKIIFVGEALVGNEAVDQLTKFDRALRDFSAASGGQERGIDGMLVTNWDTVDDKVRCSLALRSPIFLPLSQVFTAARAACTRGWRVWELLKARSLTMGASFLRSVRHCP